MKLTMTQLDAFSATMEIGTTAGAATALHSSQPSISRALKQLEDTTGLVLFERVNNRLRPTRIAYELLEVVQQSYIGLDRIARAAEELRAESIGHLHVGCLPAFSQGFIAGSIRRVVEQDGTARVNVRPMLSREVLSAMLTRDINVGLAAYAVSDDRLMSERLVSVNEVIVCHSSHPLAKLDHVRPEDLNGYDLMLLDSNDPYRCRFERHLAEYGISCPVHVEVPTSEALCSYASQNLGFALLNPVTAIDHIGTSLVMRRYTVDFPFHVTLLTSEDSGPTSVEKKFLRALKTEIAERNQRIEQALYRSEFG